MRHLLFAALLVLFSAEASAQTETSTGDFFLHLSGNRSMFLQGFRTYFGGEYVAPDKNLAYLREMKPRLRLIKIADFTAKDPDMTTLVCRLSWPVYAPAKLPYAMFLAGAMRDELTKAELYSETEGVELKANLDSINFESFGSAKWVIAVTFSAPGKAPVTVKHEMPFDVPFAAAGACRMVTSNLVPSMQEFLYAAYSDPQFQELLH